MRRFASFAVAVSAFGLFGNAPAFGQDAAEQAPPRTVDIAAHVAEASQRFGLPQTWIYAVMRTESAGRVGAVSSAGAMGLMQLMPGTWARQRSRFGLGADPFDPRANIMAGTSYLREMYDSYGTSGFLAAYNAGPGRYEDWRDRGRALPAETRAYVAKIAPMLQTASAPTVVASASMVQPVRASWTQSQLFVVRSDGDDRASGSFAAAAPTQPVTPPNSQPSGLFAPVSGSRSQ
ncbi:MAG: lytic transglycosylase domain-containing protein [Novosphingobium sp.]